MNRVSVASVACGNLFVVASPSGGGKTSLVKRLLAGLPELEVSVSHTTRSKRPGEVDGRHYFFVGEPEFLEMVARGEFIEHACVFGHYYGTATAQVHARLQAGIDVLLDIDWQGAAQIKALFPDAVNIFVIPPSLESLKERLQARKQDADEVIQSRMQQAQSELSHYTEFDYLVVNDKFEQAAYELQAIIVANRLRMSRQAVAQEKLLSFLLAP